MANVVLAGDDLANLGVLRGTGARQGDRRADDRDVLPSRRGRKPGGGYFDPALIDIAWKG